MGQDRTPARTRCAVILLAALAVVPAGAGAAASRPDLAPGAVSGAPAQLAPGGALQLAVSVRNRGRKRAKASRAALVLSTDAKLSKDDPQLAAFKVPALKPRKSKRASLRATLASDTAPGAYKLLLCADQQRKVRESSERNNCRATPLTVATGPVVPGPIDPGPIVPVPTPTPEPTATPGPDVTAPFTFDDVPDGWSQEPVTVTLFAIDVESGVAGTWYTIDGSDPSDAGNPARQAYDPAAQPVLDHGAAIRYYSTDTAGNAETVHASPAAQVDGVPPSTTDDLPPGQTDSFLEVELTATDDRSGVAETWYTTDGSDPRFSPTRAQYEDSVFLSSGYRVRYYSIDVAGNAEPLRQSALLGAGDGEAPVTTDNVPAFYLAQPVRVTLTATDTGGSGVDATYYTLDGSDPSDPFNFARLDYDPANRPLLDHGEQIRYSSSDLAGNVEAPKTSAAALVDGLAPATTDDVPLTGAPVSVTVTLTATDARSGVAETWYTTDESNPADEENDARKLYNAAAKPVIEDGSMLRYYSIDVAGNSEALKASARAAAAADSGAPPVLGEPTPLPVGAVSSLADASAFIYQGPDRVQRGVEDGAIAERRIAVLRGRVVDPAGAPVANVVVRIVDQPEYGTTRTRADGAFDMVVNGARLDVEFEKAGFAMVQTQIDAPWQDYLEVGDVIMTPYDDKVTAVDPASATPLQVVEGSPPPSAPATPPSTLLVPTGTDPEMVMPGGGTQPLADLDIRITEFSGDQNALPGTMPGNVGPTYAAEFSVDQAVAAGAERVDFAEPLINYTPNFIDAPVGSAVPSAWYDRDDAEWKPSRNGLVIEIEAEAGGRANLDIDRNDGADSDAALAAVGITDAERVRLAELYDPGQELWRVEIDHFTPWDFNWPFGPPPGATPPTLKEFEWKDPNDPCNKQGSVIACETQVLGESVPLTGSSQTLEYRSNRVPGYGLSSAIEVPVTGSVLPPELNGIEAVVNVAGRTLRQRWCNPGGTRPCGAMPPTAPNLTKAFEWDGKDAYGREVLGRPVANITVTYVYEFTYYESSADFNASFGQFPDDPTQTMSNGARYCDNQNPWGGNDHFYCGIISRQSTQRTLGPWEARDVDGLGGWTLSAHHGYDPQERVVHLGDGSTVSSEPLGAVLTNVAGDGSGSLTDQPAPALSTNIGGLGDIAVGPEGEIYGSTGGFDHNQIWRVGTDGNVRAIGGRRCVGGSGPHCPAAGDPAGDGGHAYGAILGLDISAVAAAPDGSVYFATRGSDLGSGYIRRIAPDGTLSTIAGRRWSHVSGNPNFAPAGVNGDGGQATQARIVEPREVEVAPDGAIYFSERSGHPNNFHAVVRRIGTDGVVSTVAGGNRDGVADGANVDLTGIAARDFELSVIYGIAAAPDGTLYLASPNQRKVFRVGPDGILERVAGTGVFGALELDKPAVDSRIGHPTKVALGIDGALYIRIDDECSLCSIGSEVKLLELTPDGGLAKIAGRPSTGVNPFAPGVDGEPAGSAYIEATSVGLATAPDGTVIFADGNRQLRRIVAALPGFASGDVVVPSTDGSEVYVFNSRGRHLRTLDAVTGVVRWTFSYDAERRLAAVVDGDGNRLELERSAAGAVTAIVAPGGQRTTLALDGSGYLQTLTNPAGEAFGVTYHAKGLLATFTRPGGRTSLYEYDPLGRLERAESATGAVQTLTRTETAERIEVAAASGEGRVTTYSVEVQPDGDRVRTVARPSGADTEVVVKPDGMRVRTEPDGTVTELQTGPDPRWGMRAPLPVSEVTRTPGGKQIKVGVTRTVELDDPLNPLSVKTLTTNIVRQGTGPSESTEIAYDADAGTVETRTSEGRGNVATLDDRGRVVKVQEADQALAPVLLTYDQRGRVVRIEQGSQHWTYAYDAQNRLLSRTDAGGAAIAYAYDAAGRVTQRTFPGGRTYTYGYKPGDGRLDSITMPSGDVYDVELDVDGRLVSLDAPLPPGPYAGTYDDDGLLEQVAFPSGATRDPAFDAAGREQSTDYGDVADTLAYPPNRERANLVTRTPDAGTPQGLGLGEDGLLPTSYAFSGPASGTYDLEFGSMLRLEQSTLTSGGDAAIVRDYTYDEDGLPVTEGPFTLERGGFGSSGAVTGITDGTLTTDYALDTLNRVDKKTLRTGNTVRYENDLTFDNRGRITRRVEAVGAATRTFDYTYDAAGELTTVKEGATTLEQYEYDVNGNRTRRKLGGDDRTATFDDADSITQQGARAYSHDADGFLTQRGGDSFDYSPSGDLLSATVGATTVTYGYDALGRRTSRRVGAGAAEQYLYGDPTNLLELTASRSAGGELTTYFYDAGDALYALERGGTRYYVGSDQVGTPKVVFRADGTVVKTVDYDAFGGVLSESGAFELPVGFAGGLADPVTGLVRFGLRDYDPETGRFTARDPLFFAGSPTNLYAYVGSNPVSMRDPTGLGCIGGGFMAGVGGGIQYCRKDGKNSICAEGGVGVGGGVEVDFFGGAAETGTTMVAEYTKKIGPASVTVGGELDLDCLNVKGSAKAGTAFGLSSGIDTNGDLSGTFGGSGKDDFNGVGEGRQDGRFGVKSEGKLVIKGCGQW